MKTYRLFLFVILAPIFFIFSPFNVLSANNPWSMLQHNAQHTGYSKDLMIATELSQGWVYTTQGIIQSSPTVDNETVYFGSSDGNIYAIDAIKGTLKWKFPHDPASYSSVAVSMNKVFIAFTGCDTEDASLYSLDSANGELRWTFRIGPKYPGQGGGQSSPVVVDGIVYVGSSGPTAEDNKLYAINADNKDLIWAKEIIDPNENRKGVFSSPVVTENNVIVGTWGSCNTCPTLFAFNRSTGTQKWSAIVSTPYIFPAPSTANGVVYVRSGGAGHSGDLIAYDEETGAELWRSYVGGSSGAGSPAIADNTVYIASSTIIYAFDALTGIEKWNVPAVSAGSCQYAAYIRYPFFAIANDMLFVKSDNNCDVAKVYAIGTTDGSLIWDSGLLGDNGASGGTDKSTPSVANGWLYFAIGDTLYAYNSDDYFYQDYACPNCRDPETCCGPDKWGFCIKNCTSYVAWRMNRDGGANSFKNDMDDCHWGNAGNWDQNARCLGLTVNHEPVRGAIAHWNGSEIDPVGHVAYVERVDNDGSVTVSEYNFSNPCAYGERKLINGAPRYIHVNTAQGICYVDPSGVCGGNSPCYTSIQAAINAASTGAIIRIAQGTYSESITLNTLKSLTLKGGWNSSFTSQAPNTTIIKAPKANQGSLTLQMVIIRP